MTNEIVEPSEYRDFNKDFISINLEYNTFMGFFLKSCMIEEGLKNQK